VICSNHIANRTKFTIIFLINNLEILGFICYETPVFREE
jgi:hypothetical protein